MSSSVRSSRRSAAAIICGGALAAALAGSSPAHAASAAGFEVFAPSFVENAAAHTVDLPRHTGTSHGQPVTFVITDASTRQAADRYGVNFAPRLANAAGSAGVERVARRAAGLDFPATVDFTASRDLTPGPTGFPPRPAEPGAVGEPGYSPLVQLPDGTVLNAPHVANASGQADKLVARTADTITYRESDGFYDHRAVHYASFEASIPIAAALENAALAPALNDVPPDLPTGTHDPLAPAREEIGIFTNGQTGVGSAERQGLSSALIDGLDPLNVLGEVPRPSRNSGYSPIWDAHLAQWTPAAVTARLNTRQTSFPDILRLADQGLVTAPDGGSFRRSDFDINCPAISIQG